MTKCKIGVIGCGHLGKLHIRNLLELSKEVPELEISGCFDSDITKTKDVSESTGIKKYSSLQDILNNSDAVLIVTSTSSHFGIAETSLKQGKHIFMEKPVTKTTEEAIRLKELRKELIVQVGHIERFNPALMSLDNFNIEPMFIESHRLAQFNPRGTDVSVIQDLMIHDIDIVLHLVKSDVKAIQANGVPVLSDNADIANARISFQNGCVANITSSRISLKKMRKMRIFQKNAYISVDFLNNTTEVFRIAESDVQKNNEILIPFEYGSNKLNIGYEKKEAVDINAMKYEQKLFIECIIKNKKPLVSLEDGIKALEVASWINKAVSIN